MESHSPSGGTGSPRSSGPVDSTHGTPETKITVFSPEDARSVTGKATLNALTNLDAPQNASLFTPTSSSKAIGRNMINADGPPVFALGQSGFSKSNEWMSPVKSFTSHRASRVPFGLEPLPPYCGKQDPFLSSNTLSPITGTDSFDSKRDARVSKLSPIASTFNPSTPSAMFTPTSASTTSSFVEPHEIESVCPMADKLSPISPRGLYSMDNILYDHEISVDSQGGLTAIEESASPQGQLKHYLRSIVPQAPPVSPFGHVSASTNGTLLKRNFSSDETVTRAFEIGQISVTASLKDLEKLFNVRVYPTLRDVVVHDPSSQGAICLRFFDIRESEQACNNAARHTGWTVRYMTPAQFGQRKGPTATPVSQYEGHIIVKIDLKGRLQSMDSQAIVTRVEELFASYGSLHACQIQVSPDNVELQGILEFCDTRVADAAVEYLNGFEILDSFLTVVLYDRELEAGIKQQGRGEDLSKAFEKMMLRPDSPFNPADKSCLSVTGRSILPHRENDDPWQIEKPYSGLDLRGSRFQSNSTMRQNDLARLDQVGHTAKLWDLSGPGAIGQERALIRQPNFRHGLPLHSRSNLNLAGRREHDFTGHNVVDVERIRQGLDVRTTIMLRNIPNKIDQAMLKDIIDETSLGKYDFMYLRIDFANNCNVGYVFVNFEDPWFIIDFVNARAGKRWNRFNSDKVAEVSYATIQGKDCLVQKFRNSSVMLEHPSFRPKLYHTGTGPLAGTEDKFPGPDNSTKMRRSIENAEHVGLFAPRAGQYSRTEQRRRRSQYDRGTRLAELEESLGLSMQKRIDDGLYQHFMPGELSRASRSGRPNQFFY